MTVTVPFPVNKLNALPVKNCPMENGATTMCADAKKGLGVGNACASVIGLRSATGFCPVASSGNTKTAVIQQMMGAKSAHDSVFMRTPKKKPNTAKSVRYKYATP